MVHTVSISLSSGDLHATNIWLWNQDPKECSVKFDALMIGECHVLPSNPGSMFINRNLVRKVSCFW